MGPWAETLTPGDHLMVASLKDAEVASLALAELVQDGIPQPRIAILSRDDSAANHLLEAHPEYRQIRHSSAISLSQAAEGSGRLEWRSALRGVAAGAALTLVTLALPGLGPAVLAGGPLAIARTAIWLATAGAGIAMLWGAILDDRDSESLRAAYEAELKQGHWLIAVHGTRPEVDQAAGMLRRFKPLQLQVF
ncbi:MAG: hypothetical protein VKP62_04620 [Candidatus Sericytochromatia bacterium]|nr:hypothetical protein [Candidatus Sericytochromatia bacterium]